jgi:hypothetical protein
MCKCDQEEWVGKEELESYLMVSNLLRSDVCLYLRVLIQLSGDNRNAKAETTSFVSSTCPSSAAENCHCTSQCNMSHATQMFSTS